MKNEDNGVIAMYLHGRPNLLSIFSKWVDSYFSKKGEGYLDWRKEYLKGLGINVDLMDYEGDWDDEDYYESMDDWYNSHLNDDSYWNPSPSEEDDYDDYGFEETGSECVGHECEDCPYKDSCTL